MAKRSVKKKKRKEGTVATVETPTVPQQAPDADYVHVALTNPDDDECVVIRIQSHAHYLHSTTARELSNMLQKTLKQAADPVGFAASKEPRNDAPTVTTHEPRVPINWPHGHVRVASAGERSLIWIHGHEHRLHAATAQELSSLLLGTLDAYNERLSRQGLADMCV